MHLEFLVDDVEGEVHEDVHRVPELRVIADLDEDRFPLQGAVDPAEVADAVAWLLDARRVTAQTIFVDAGQHLRQWKEPAA